MSWFNRALELCGDDESRAAFRAAYWAKSHRTNASRATSKQRWDEIWPKLSDEQQARVYQAIELWNETKRARR